jgi:hypothetical protein
MAVAEYDEDLSKKIVNNITYLEKLYNTVFEAAHDITVQINQDDDKLFIEYGTKSRIKRVAENTRNFDVENTNEVESSKDIKIEYNPNNICITGGSALTVYDYYLKEYITAKELQTLESMTSRKTPDIDMVWWPTYNNPKYAIISASDMIHNFALRVKDSLERYFINNFKNTDIKIGTEIYRIAGDGIIIQDNFSLPVSYPKIEGYKYGTHQLNVIFKFTNGVKCKLIDLSIYDTASNQTSPKEAIQPMRNDPIYIKGEYINRLKINNIRINVPIIAALEEQQRYAYGRRANKQNIYSKRLEYMEQLFKNIKNENLNTIKNDKLISTEYVYSLGKKNLVSTYKRLNGSIYALSDEMPLTREEIQAQKTELDKYNKLMNERYIYYYGKKNKISTYKRLNGTIYSTKLANIPLSSEEKITQDRELYRQQKLPYRTHGIYDGRQYRNEYGKVFELHHMYIPKSDVYTYVKTYVGGKNKTRKNRK